MADEKTDRLLPTHFLLAGEVRSGEELEHADFLLTDHPKAAAALDLLLGTQGWRRFAEQAPGEFKSRHGGRRPRRCWWRWASGSAAAPVWRSDARRVFDEYWPKYEAAVVELDAAEKDQRSGESVAGLRSDVGPGRDELPLPTDRVRAGGADLMFFDKSMESRRPWLPVTLTVAFGGGLALLVVRFLRKRRQPGAGAADGRRHRAAEPGPLRVARRVAHRPRRPGLAGLRRQRRRPSGLGTASRRDDRGSSRAAARSSTHDVEGDGSPESIRPR